MSQSSNLDLMSIDDTFKSKESNQRMASKRHFPQLNVDSNLGFNSLPSRGKYNSRPNILNNNSNGTNNTNGSSKRSSIFPDIATSSATEYRDKYKPFTFKLPLNNNNQESINVSKLPVIQINGHKINQNGANDLVDGHHSPSTSVNKLNKFKKTEYKSKFKPFDNYAYIPMNGYKKVKNMDQTSARAAKDWFSLVSESRDVNIDNRRKAMFGTSITGSQSLNEIYRRDSIEGPWFRRDPKYHSMTREDIIRTNNHRL